MRKRKRISQSNRRLLLPKAYDSRGVTKWYDAETASCLSMNLIGKNESVRTAEQSLEYFRSERSKSCRIFIRPMTPRMKCEKCGALSQVDPQYGATGFDGSIYAVHLCSTCSREAITD